MCISSQPMRSAQVCLGPHSSSLPVFSFFEIGPQKDIFNVHPLTPGDHIFPCLRHPLFCLVQIACSQVACLFFYWRSVFPSFMSSFLTGAGNPLPSYKCWDPFLSLLSPFDLDYWGFGPWGLHLFSFMTSGFVLHLRTCSPSQYNTDIPSLFFF